MALNRGKTKVDLRSLMKTQRQEKTSNVKKIESPLAKYNSLGQLTCIVCNIPVKSEIIWNAHIQGKKHRQNMENIKSKVTGHHPAGEDKATLPTSSKLKRKVESKEADIPVPKKVPAKSTSSNYTSSSAQEMKVKMDNKMERESKPTKSEKTKVSSTPSMKDSLPEGFFDDPTVDAKVRRVELKNNAKEEWVKFQKEMDQQQQASRVILEADEAATQMSRNITEIDEQIQRFANVEKLRDKQDDWKAQKLGKRNTSSKESGSSEDEEDYAEFLDWRSKGAFK